MRHGKNGNNSVGRFRKIIVVDKDFWKNKKVFITGHTGFKGSWLSLWLHALEAKVSGYALDPSTNPSLYDLGGVKDILTSVIGDIRDLDLLKKAMKECDPDIVIHMAAQPLVRDSYKEPVETYATNVMGTVNLFEAVRGCRNVRAVLNVTTDKCYENKEWEWGYRENEPLGGYDPYSNSKACSELVTSSYRDSFFNSDNYENHGVGVASARAGNVIGGGDWAKDRLIPDCVKSLLTGEEIVIRNPHAIRPWQHVLEPLSGYLLLMQRLFENGPEFSEAWNFGPDDRDAKPVAWIVKEICSKWGNDSLYRIDKGAHPHEANYLKLDCSKAKHRLRWYPKWSIEQAIDKIIEWTMAYNENHGVREITLKQIDEYPAQQVKV